MVWLAFLGHRYRLHKFKHGVPGIDLLSQANCQVSSTLIGLTSEFGMESGVALSLETPGTPCLNIMFIYF